MPDSLDGRRVTVMGLGRFGGGVGVTRWLVGQNARVVVTDREDADSLRDSVERIADLVDSGSVTLRLGGHERRDFEATDLVIANPAVARPWENPCLVAATDNGVPITTEMNLVIERLPTRERVIGVTGSAGKSTTSALIAHTLTRLGHRAHLGGNIGGSLLDRIEEIGADDVVVLELSSAMLHWVDGWSPGTSVITNITPNHLDWHGTLEHYVASKGRIVSWMEADDVLVSSRDVEPHLAAVGVVVPGVTGMRDAEAWTSLAGAHNRVNERLAGAACERFADSTAVIREGMRDFGGLPHRLCTIEVSAGITFIDDSKSTTPGSVVMAIDAVRSGARCRIHLIAGGYDKGVSLASMAEAAARECVSVHTIGATGRDLASFIGDQASYHDSLEDAVRGCLSHAVSGDVVLLSPGCASWDQFINFEERGRAFARCVQRFAAESSSQSSR